MAKDNKIEELNIEEPEVTPMATPPVVEPASVPASPTLDDILARMAVLEADNKNLRKAVNLGKLTEAENANKPDSLPVAYLKVFKGKVVTSWKSGTSQFIYNPSNPEFPIGEILKATYFFIDGSDSGEVDQVEFTRTGDRVEAEVVEGMKGLKDPDSKEVTLHFTKLITTDEDLQNKFELPVDFKINKNFLNP